MMSSLTWLFKMAWRDSRSSRRRLLLYLSSIVLGVAALVAVNSLAVNLESAVEEQARTLLGADLALSTRQGFSEEAERILAEIPGEQARETSFASMAYFPESDSTRFVQVRALNGAFPFFGELETEPAEAAENYKNRRAALVDESLLFQFGEAVGGVVKLGYASFEIAGALRKIPGESAAFSIIGPRIYIPAQYLDETELIQTGSRVQYRAYFKLPDEQDLQGLLDELEPRLNLLQINVDTVEQRKAGLGRSLRNLYGFLNLVAFISLLLGGVGVGSAIHLFIKQKIPTIAVLRCLGASTRQTFAVYLVQTVALACIGAALGTLAGISVQQLLPYLLTDFLPLEIPFFIAWKAILIGFGLGVGMALLFALIPLLAVRKVSPLLAIRSDFEPTTRGARDPVRFLAYTLLLAAVFGFAWLQTQTAIQAAAFWAGLLTVFLLLAATAKGLMGAVRRFFPSNWRYVWRQGLANLFRPQNQTLVLMLCLGLGTFLIVTLYLVQLTLLQQVQWAGSEGKPNLVLFDIQADQSAEVAELVRDFGLPVLQQVPIVTMRLRSIDGRTVEEILEEPDREIRRWALNREYRSTFRDHLIETEHLVSGQWIGRYVESMGLVPISVERGVASELQLNLGDELVFDVQGVPVATRVASLRSVEWERIQPNFFVIFPAGVLEEAPMFEVLVTRVESSPVSAELQKSVVQRFPNVSAIDLNLVLSTVDAILDRAAFAIRFLALFTILTGLVVLTGAVATSRYQRTRESVLLRTLGASRSQVTRILLVEYLLLGGLGALTGVLLALAAAWSLARFFFEVTFADTPVSTLAVVLGTTVLLVVTLTILIGMAASRGVTSRPPLEVLRSEAF